MSPPAGVITKNAGMKKKKEIINKNKIEMNKSLRFIFIFVLIFFESKIKEMLIVKIADKQHLNDEAFTFSNYRHTYTKTRKKTLS